MVARLLVMFGGIALVVAGIGVYGLTAYTVVIGLSIGIAAAALLGRLVQSLLLGVTPSDPLTLLGTVVVLTVTMVAATTIPAVRAARVDPVAALRVD